MKSGIFNLILDTSKYAFMKKFTTLFILLSGVLLCQAQSVVTPPDPLELKQTEHDFAKIPQGKPVYCMFDVVNTGVTELKLDNVQASCGCTTPEWSHDPIPAGGMTTIKVGYNAANEGYFEKTITISYNAHQTKVLKIKGTVWKAPEGAAPANASVEFLKKQTL